MCVKTLIHQDHTNAVRHVIAALSLRPLVRSGLSLLKSEDAGAEFPGRSRFSMSWRALLLQEEPGGPAGA